MAEDRRRPNSAYCAYYLGRLMADSDFTKAPNCNQWPTVSGVPQGPILLIPQDVEIWLAALRRTVQRDIWYHHCIRCCYAMRDTDLNDSTAAVFFNNHQMSAAKPKLAIEQVVIRAVTARGCSGWDGEG